MWTLNELVQKLIHQRADGTAQVTLLAVCPNSEAVLEAAVKAAAANNTPMLFAATLNQVDRDGGYTGWTPAQFVARMRAFSEKYQWDGPLYPCLDHGGPWLKDRHTLQELSLEETTAEVTRSLVACLEAGYQLLHIDATEDYPRSGMGGANVGPELTAVEYHALVDLCTKEADLRRTRPGLNPSGFMATLEQAVVESGRWKKWLLPEELGRAFDQLRPERREWLVQTGSRYIWAAPSVVSARHTLYGNLAAVIPDPHQVVVDRIAWAIERYVVAFHLFDSLTLVERQEEGPVHRTGERSRTWRI